VIADAFSRVFINPEVLSTLSDFIASKMDSPEPPASSKIDTSIAAPTHSANSPLHQEGKEFAFCASDAPSDAKGKLCVQTPTNREPWRSGATGCHQRQCGCH